MIREEIEANMKQAMRDRDREKLEVLRYIWSDIKNAEIDAKKQLDDNAVTTLLRREVKKRTQAIDQFESAGRDDLVTHEKDQLIILEAYLPQLLSEMEITIMVDEVVAGGATEFGLVMRTVLDRTGASADGKMVSEIVRTILAKANA